MHVDCFHIKNTKPLITKLLDQGNNENIYDSAMHPLFIISTSRQNL
jgi:hypothetical protein